MDDFYHVNYAKMFQSTINSEGFKGGTRGAPIMPRDAVSRTANVERTNIYILSLVCNLNSFQNDQLSVASVSFVNVEVKIYQLFHNFSEKTTVLYGLKHLKLIKFYMHDMLLNKSNLIGSQ